MVYELMEWSRIYICKRFIVFIASMIFTEENVKFRVDILEFHLIEIVQIFSEAQRSLSGIVRCFSLSRI